jgi:hypothetical protein
MTYLAELPFVDEYSRVVRATPDRTLRALQEYVERLTTSPHRRLAPLLGTVPRSGFEVVDSDPPREIVLGGRHRVSTYRLVFRIEPGGDTSHLHALTYAEFPDLRGRVYRAGLMVSKGHRRAPESMLREVARHAEAQGPVI